jgi:uncharacterized protein (DUF2225 family)
MNTDLLRVLSGSANAKRYYKDHVVIEDGEKIADEMFIILAGKVGVYKNYRQPGEVKLTELGPGAFFGEMSLFLHKERTATVVCQTDLVILMVINRVNAYDVFEKQPELVYNIIKTLCERLLEANKYRSGSSAPAPVAAPSPGVASPGGSPTAASAPPKAAAPARPVSAAPGFFPEGHKGYSIEIPNAPMDLLYERKFECPLCTHPFTTFSARETKLKVVERGKDFRVTHQGIDLVHYELVTCPSCYFSTFDANYKEPIASRFYANTNNIKAFKTTLNLPFGKERRINDIFAGYYLAMKGTEWFYAKSEALTAKLWLRLMWLYQDCDDAEMEAYTLKQAHAAYITMFENTEISANAAQQLCVLIGELSLRVDDIPSAKTYFTKARMHRSGSQALLTMAEDGIEELRKREAK